MEIDMNTTPSKSPDKFQVRAYMEHRRVEHTPPPSPEEIRRQLGPDFQGRAVECMR
jgi:hypothetical protein